MGYATFTAYAYISYSKKNWRWKILANKDYRKFGGKTGEFKSICIGNAMEIAQIGEKTWWNTVICQICQIWFYCQCFLQYSSYCNTHCQLSITDKIAMGASLMKSTKIFTAKIFTKSIQTNMKICLNIKTDPSTL